MPFNFKPAAVVALNEIWIRTNLDKWLSDLRTASFLLEKDAILTATASRAVFGEEVMSRFIRDLHLYARTAGWLLFGAVSRAPSMTTMRTGAEECKMYPEGEGDPICPFKATEVPCACDWDDNYATEETCTAFPRDGIDSSRYVQSSFVEGQKNDADPSTGNRSPLENRPVYDQASKTNWWESFDELPVGAIVEEETSSLNATASSFNATASSFNLTLLGFNVTTSALNTTNNRARMLSESDVNKTLSESGFYSTYDRVRTLSAMATVEFPLYNYFPGRDESKHLGMYLGIEADGMVNEYPQ